jgi:hypothetical protein
MLFTACDQLLQLPAPIGIPRILLCDHPLSLRNGFSDANYQKIISYTSLFSTNGFNQPHL